MKKIPILIALLCIGQYFNQGISSLPQQCIYYLCREHWNLSATVLGLIGWTVGLAWYLKIFFAYLVDNITIRGKKTFYYLIFTYSSLLILYLYIILFGFNLVSLIIVGTLVNICIAFSDVTVDREMVIAEQKNNLKSRLQAIQWSSLGIAGIIVALGGAYIAKIFPEHINYKIAYGIAGISPLLMLIYLFRMFKEEPIKKMKKISLFSSISSNFKKLQDKRFLIGLLFIASLQFCPSFGVALTIKAREVLQIDKMFLGYLGSMGTILGVTGYIIYYKWAYKFPMKKLLYFMILFTAITNLFYLYLPNKWFLVSYNLAFGAFGGIAFMTLLAFFVKIIPLGSEAFFYALVTSISNFFGRLGGVVGGYLYDQYGYNINVIIASITTLACLLFIPYLKIKEERLYANT